MKKKREAAASSKPNILVIDDHPIVRHGLVQLLKQSRQFEVCGDSGVIGNLAKLLEEKKPRALLIDLFLEGEIATAAIREARRNHPDLAILVISMQNEAYYAEQALQAGADGFILKEEATDQILHALRQVLSGKTYLSFSLIKRMMYRYAGRGDGKRETVRRLSEREFQVLRLLSEGLSSVRIAEELGVGVKSVDTYRFRLKKKLQLQNNAELLRYAVRWSLPS